MGRDWTGWMDAMGWDGFFHAVGGLGWGFGLGFELGSWLGVWVVF